MHIQVRMDVEVVRAFTAVAEQGSLNKAAEKLRVAQSTLTRQIQALESEVGGQLLERSTRGVLPTAAGRALLEAMRPVLRSYDEAIAETRRVALGKTARLRLGYIQTAAADFVQPALAALRKEHPEVKVRLLDLTPGEQIAGLREGRLDLAVVGQAGKLLSGEFYTRRMAVLPVLAAVSDASDLASHKAVKIAELKGIPFVGAQESDMPGNNRWVAQLCRRAGFRPRFIHDAESVNDAFATIVLEGATGLFPAYMSCLAVPGVRWLPVTDPGARWDLYVAWQRGRPSAAVLAFLKALGANRSALS